MSTDAQARALSQQQIEEARRCLVDLYQALWVEAVYDPTNADAQAFAKLHLPKIQTLNRLLRFKT